MRKVLSLLALFGALSAFAGTDSAAAPQAAKKKGGKAKPAASAASDKDKKSAPQANSKNQGGPARMAGGAPVDPSARDYSSLISTHKNALGQTVYQVQEAYHDVSLPLGEMIDRAGPWVARPSAEEDERENDIPARFVHRSAQPDPVMQVPFSKLGIGVSPNPPATGFNFAGMGTNGGGGAAGTPPDPNGSVGGLNGNQFVETVNTSLAIYTLNRVASTAALARPIANINTLWAGFGGACQTNNDGDPVVLWDKLAQRWFISQFTVAYPGSQCVAVSTTTDALGTYNRYEFPITAGAYLGDYPHFGVWSDGYYMAAHLFDSAGTFNGGMFAAMDRAKMLTGAAATMQYIVDANEYGQMPADIDGFAPPPTGAPGIFVNPHGTGAVIWRYKVDWTTPANTARTVQATLPIANYSDACYGPVAAANAAITNGNCVFQPGTTVRLQSLSGRAMFRLAYRNAVDHESLVFTHSVEPGPAGIYSGVRWYEFRMSGRPDAQCPAGSTGGYPCLYQQGTIGDVANGRDRWMGGVAMDTAGNMIMSYNVSGKTANSDNQSVRYTSRAAGDPLNTMTGPETIIVTGTKNMNALLGTPGRGRWGDYSSTSVDPSDDCIIWHVGEYYTTAGTSTWNTQIASTRFPAGSGAGQCPATTCAARPATAPTIGTATTPAANQIAVTWTGIAPAPGSYAIERAVGSCAAPGYYAPVGSVSGATTTFTDTAVQGGVRYAYRVVAAADAGGKCQGTTYSGCVEAVATGNCTLKPTFNGATVATSNNTAACGVTVNWAAGSSNCPLAPTIRYNIFRGTTPNFTPAVANRIATCAPGPSSYSDGGVPTGGTTYYYVVRAEDNTTVNGGECGGGNEEANSTVVPGTAYGAGLQAATGTWSDGAGDGTSFMQMNPASTATPAEPFNPNTANAKVWRYVSTATDAGVSHTGTFGYRTAGPTATDTYSDKTCAEIRSPVLTTGAGTVNLAYWMRYNQEYQWDGVFVEYSQNNGPWTTAPNPAPATDWGALTQTLNPPINACGYPATGPSGYTGPGPTNPATSTPYAQRTHAIAGFANNDTIRFRLRSSSDDAANFTGFYLDDITVSNIHLPNTCTACSASSPPTMGNQTLGKAAPNITFTWPTATGATSYTNYSAATPNPGTWTSRNTGAGTTWTNAVDLGAAGSFFYTTTASNCFGESPK